MSLSSERHIWWKVNVKKKHFLSFLHLKFHSSCQKHTSQKWCLEVSTTCLKEVRAKKRLSVVWSVKNDVFRAKINQFCWKYKHFLEIQGCHTWWFWMKTDDYYMLWFLRLSSPKTCFSSKSIIFCIDNQDKKLKYMRILNA